MEDFPALKRKSYSTKAKAKNEKKESSNDAGSKPKTFNQIAQLIQEDSTYQDECTQDVSHASTSSKETDAIANEISELPSWAEFPEPGAVCASRDHSRKQEHSGKKGKTKFVPLDVDIRYDGGKQGRLSGRSQSKHTGKQNSALTANLSKGSTVPNVGDHFICTDPLYERRDCILPQNAQTTYCATDPTGNTQLPDSHDTTGMKILSKQKASSKRERKQKPVMRPAPELSGFKGKMRPKKTLQSLPTVTSKENQRHRAIPRRGKHREKGTVVPTIQEDSSDSSTVDDDEAYIWLGTELSANDVNWDNLQDLQTKSPTVIGLTLARSTNSLKEMLRENTASIDDDLLLVSMLSKACSCKVIQHSASQIFSLLQTSNFFTVRMKQLTGKVREQANVINSCSLWKFFPDMITLLHEKKVTSLGTDVTILPRLLLMALAKALKDKLGEYHGIIIKELDTLKETKIEASKEAKEYDFRRVQIMPRDSDIDPNTKPDLKKNKESGSYASVDEYLDVQFRLLREDFIQPLRQGISEYQELMNKADRKALRLYQNVKIRRILCSENGIVYRLQFDVGKLSHVDWCNTKRLMYGSMVCISTDKFITVRFATVSDRKPERLQQGKVDIKFDSKFKLDPRTVFVMVETPALFEAYRHILVGLQNIERDQFPFKKYLVECEQTVAAPAYLESKPDTPYDLSVLKTAEPVRTDLSFDSQSHSDEENYAMLEHGTHLFSTASWPTAKDLHMDASQYRAFHTALTRELAVIQGPPGTGKTYVGLKIMKALLNNAQAWNPTESKPLLVVCYTNHALDQFLVGIAEFFKGSILRVGGRSKNENLVNHNINRRRLDLYRKRWLHDDEIRDILEIRKKLRDDFIAYQRKIEEYGQQIDATTTGIMHEDQLKSFMKDHYYNIKKAGNGAPSALLKWLEVTGIGNAKPPTESSEDHNAHSEDEEHDDTSKERKVDDVDIHLRKQTERLSHFRNRCLAFNLSDCDLSDKEWNKKHSEKKKKDSRMTLKARLRKEILAVTRMDEKEVSKVDDVFKLTPADKWRLYRYWVDRFCEKLHHDMEPLKTGCQNAADRYKEANGLVDKYIFEHSDVIGMTTTGAARYHSILSSIQPPVIIVEEAAEVLEGHIVTSLSPGCQHLILIGDHQQLRPSPNVYDLATKYNLDLSLFERLINNGLHCDTLELQHRMRPEISNVMRHIYPNLKDHDSVMAYENVKGVTENIFFINHNVPESENRELLSHLNDFEAQYLTQLCQYLLKQGYRADQITILSAYSAQVSRLRSLMREESQAGVIITAVDNYQGEENDIVLLSLVRSNSEDRIGFLKTDNRICVALSRAKLGLYVIGNFDLLSRHSKTWNSIVEDMKTLKRFGPGLELYCQTHPEDKKVITDPKQFSSMPDGGCMKECEYVLNCGHICRRHCHAYDAQHKAYLCMQPCEKNICKLGHKCPDKCSDQCEPCQTLVEKTLPGCGHNQLVPCSEDPADQECKSTCEEILECGHRCGNICGRDHICYESVNKKWPCGHESDVLCLDKDIAVCQSACTTKLNCGHTCQGSCKACSEGRLHQPCQQPCNKILICGHKCQSSCSKCSSCTFECETKCAHRNCKALCGQRCEPCHEPCVWKCPHYKCPKKCTEPCERAKCDKRCRLPLKCKHTCIGLCGEPCPLLCRKCNKEDVLPFLPDSEDIPTARFVYLQACGHIVEVKALDKIFDQHQNEKNIGFPSCPWCNTVIRENSRYGSILKKIERDIELAKAEYDGRVQECIQELSIRITDDMDSLKCRSDVDKLFQRARKDESRLAALKSQSEFLLHIETLEQRLGSGSEDIKADMENFKQWLLLERDVFQDQETIDAQSELSRIKSLMLLDEIRLSENEVSVGFLKEVEDMWERVKDWKQDAPNNEESALALKTKWLNLSSGPDVDDLTYGEVQVWESLSMAVGNWYRCPNGKDHVLGANERTDTAECRVCEELLDNDPCDQTLDDETPSC